MSKYSELSSLFRGIFSEVKNEDNAQIQVNCPRCRDESGSDEYDGKFNLEINFDRRAFRCWKCDPKFSGYNLEYLIKEFGTKDDLAEYKQIREDYFDLSFDDDEDRPEIETPEVRVELPDEYIPFSSMDLENPDHLHAYNYLVLERKISREIMLKYRLGFCVEGRFKNRIIIPSYDKNGRLNYFVARTWIDGHRPTYMNPKIEKGLFIYNEGRINWDATVYLVEGGFEELSFPVNTIPLLGKVLGTKLFYELKDKKPEIIVILDPDAVKDAIRLYEQLESIYFDCTEKVKIIMMEGKYDLDEVKRNFDVEGVKNVIRSARYLNDLDYLRLK
jgi:5S rRNA maturation endonuclease (ribonuclease M5)